MNRRWLFILCFSIVCVVITVEALYSYSEQVADQKLQNHIRKLNSMGCIVEERPLSDFRDDEILKDTFWNDFSLEVDYLGVDYVYYDRVRQLLYFIRPYPVNGMKVEPFSYKWKISDLLV